MMIVELIPTNWRKSFYGKAKVIIDGTASYLLSYLKCSGIGMGTTEFWALPVEDMPRLCVTL